MSTRRVKALPQRKHYMKSVLSNIILASVLIFISLAIGVVGYHHFLQIGWIDSLLNASMILTGMGPVDHAVTDGAKIFASIYAIYSGVAFLTSVAVIFSPVLSRFLHKLHLDLNE